MFLVGLLSLATPIAVEALVNTVAFGRFVQPVVVLAILLFGFLSFLAAMQGLQTFVVEIIQRRMFARMTAAFRTSPGAGVIPGDLAPTNSSPKLFF